MADTDAATTADDTDVLSVTAVSGSDEEADSTDEFSLWSTVTLRARRSSVAVSLSLSTLCLTAILLLLPLKPSQWYP